MSSVSPMYISINSPNDMILYKYHYKSQSIEFRSYSIEIAALITLLHVGLLVNKLILCRWKKRNVKR